MRYILRQRMLAWGNDFTITDADGNGVMYVDGHVFTLGDKFTMHDTQGNVLATVEQRIFSWGPTYEVFRPGQDVATISKKLFTFFGSKFKVDVPGPNDYHVEGSLFGYDYTFSRPQHGVVAQASKKWISWTDFYGIDIADHEDHVLILAAAVVIDQVCHEGSD